MGLITRFRFLKGCLFIILSAVIYGCMPLMAKYIYADGVNSFTLVFLRNFLALPSLAILAFVQQKTLRVPLKLLPSVSLIALLGCCITPVLLFSSYLFIASGTATVFHFVYPALVVLGGILFFRDRPSAGNRFCVLLCAAGVFLFYTPGESFHWQGSLLALSSGATFAAYILLLSRFDKNKLSGFLFSFVIAGISSIAMFVLCICTGQLALPSTLLGWGLCFLFANAVTTGAVVLFQQGTFLIGGQRASILSTLEPITSIFLGVLVFHEPLTLRVTLGSCLVIAASVLTAVFDLLKMKGDHHGKNSDRK